VLLHTKFKCDSIYDLYNVTEHPHLLWKHRKKYFKVSNILYSKWDSLQIWGFSWHASASAD